MSSKSGTIRPGTFKDLAWVKGIDKLPALQWLQSNPDGQRLLAEMRAHGLFESRVTDVAIFAGPLRNLVKLQLEGPPHTDTPSDVVSGMLVIIKVLVPTWSKSFQDDEGIKRSLDWLKDKFPATPLTFQAFLEHVRADVRHYNDDVKKQTGDSTNSSLNA